jgi:C1A family cysteine protease
MPTNTSHNYTLTIGNDGNATLTYDISDRETIGVGSGPGAGSQGPEAGPGKKDEAGAEAEGALQLAPPNPDFLEFQQNPPELFYGYIPPPMDLSHLDEIPVEGLSTRGILPSSFDWRDTNKVTSVKDQNPCGTCWAFGTTSVLESAVLIGKDTEYNFSEQSVALCVDRSWVYLYDEADEPCGLVPGHGGGNSFRASEVFIKKGAVLESCNSYNPSGLQCNGACVCDSCTPVKKVNGYRYVTGDQSQTGLIKDAVYNHGPVTMAFYYEDSYKYTDPTYGTVYDCTACTSTNHIVSIIGWNDNVPHFGTPGTGAWLVKNSWGTGWGNSGYFWLAYDSSCMTEIAYLEYEDYDPNEMIYYWDEAGQVGAAGCGTPSAWIANIFASAQDVDLTHVDFWTTSKNAEYEIYVYLDGDISDGLQNQATSQSGTCQEFGYYSIPLSSPVSLSNGQQFTIAVKMTTPDFNYPLPVERQLTQGANTICDPPIQSGVSYARCSDTGDWEDVQPYGWNVCLRARVATAAGEDCPWLSESPISGSVAAGEPSDNITVTIDTTGLSEGDYNAEIVIDNNDLDENPTIVPVALRVSSLMEGDTTLNRHVTIIDAMFIAQHLVLYRTLNADQLKCADTLGDDGNVNIMDAMWIARWLVDPTTVLWDPVKDADMLPPVP